MQSNHKKRICIVARSLSEGGSDKVAAMQSVYLCNLGYQVFLITILDDIAYQYKGTLLNLGLLKKADDSFLGRINRFIAFRNFIKNNHIDCIIDHRVRIKTWSEWLISKYIYGSKAIYVVHSSAVERFFPQNQFIAKSIYKTSKQMVAVTPKIENTIKNNYGYQNVLTIPNAIDFKALETLKLEPIKDLPETYILWYGRLDNEVKNLKLLIDAFLLSKLYEVGVSLLILGKGKDEAYLNNYCRELNLEAFIKFPGFVKNPFKYIHNSLFVALTSKHEGFPMSMIESLACGVPVVSVKFKNFEDAPIQNEHNGLLVENNQPNTLANAFKTFVNNKELYFSCKQNAVKSVAHLNVEDISQKWVSIIEKP